MSLTEHCKICGKEIMSYNITSSCKSCFNSCYRKKDKYGRIIVQESD